MVNDNGGESQVEQAAEVEVSEGQTLLDKYTKTEDESAGVDTKPNEGEVEMFADRFKSIEELEKGYKELRSKIGEQGKIAPDQYEVNLGEGYQIEEGDELLASFSEIAKKHNLTNEAFNELVKFKLDSDMSVSIDPVAEMEALGPKANEMIKGVDLFIKGSVSPESYEVLRDIATTADVVKALNELKNSTKQFNPPAPGQAETAKRGATLEDAEAALAKARAAEQSNDPDAALLRKRASALFKEVYPE